MMPEAVRKYILSYPKLASIYQVVNNLLFPVVEPTVISMKILRKRLFNIIDRNVDQQKLMINIGGGYYFRRHWKVMDFPSTHYRYLKGAVDYIFDLTAGVPFPFQDNLLLCIYSSHTFEHIPQEHCQHIFQEIYRCLGVGGAVRIMLPDFDLAYDAFANNNIDFFEEYPGTCIEEKFLNFFATYLQNKISRKELWENFRTMKKENFANYYTQQIPRESQRENAGNHINWWNYEKLSRMLTQTGFSQVYPSTPQKSHFPEMRGVGRKNAFDSTHPTLSFIVEAIK